MCGLSGKVTLAGAHLVDPRSLEFSESHEGVGFRRDGVLIRGTLVKVRPLSVEGGVQKLQGLVGSEVIFP